jgi:GTP-binding protein
MIDAYTDDIATAYTTIRNELLQYSPELTTRPEVVALTKSEGLDDEMIQMQVEAVRAVAGKKAEVFAISSSAHKGITEVLRALRVKVQLARSIEKEMDEIDDDAVVISLSDKQVSDAWVVTKDAETGHFVVTGDKVEKFARRTNFDNYEGVNRLRDILKKLGVNHELSRAGAVGDSIVEIAGHEFTLLEQ